MQKRDKFASLAAKLRYEIDAAGKKALNTAENLRSDASRRSALRLKLAEKIASKSTMTVSTGKKAFYAQSEMDLSKAYEYTSEVMKSNVLTEDAKEGISAFIEKRSPNWAPYKNNE